MEAILQNWLRLRSGNSNWAENLLDNLKRFLENSRKLQEQIQITTKGEISNWARNVSINLIHEQPFAGEVKDRPNET